MTNSSSFINTVAQWATRPYLRFSKSAHSQTRICLLDTLACMYAGAHQPQTRKVMAAMRALQSPGPANQIGNVEHFSLPATALANGVAAHVLDFDDYELAASTHPGAPIFGALFSLSRVQNYSLEHLLNAYLVGYEVITRLGEALGYQHYLIGWHSTSTIGCFGAAAASSYALGHNTATLANALAIVSSNAAGLKAQFGTDTKALHAGLTARAGLEAAFLASAGVKANNSIFEQPRGFLEVYGTRQSPGLSPNFESGLLGFAMDEYPVVRKKWPCCAYTHRSIEAALSLSKQRDIDRSKLVSIRIRIPAPYYQPVAIVNPATSCEARFSLAYCVATALVNGDVSLSSFSDDAIKTLATRELISRIQIEPYDPGPDLEDITPSAPDSITIAFDNGDTVSETVNSIPGGPGRPLGKEEIFHKFSQCGGTDDEAHRILDGDSATNLRIDPGVMA